MEPPSAYGELGNAAIRFPGGKFGGSLEEVLSLVAFSLFGSLDRELEAPFEELFCFSLPGPPFFVLCFLLLLVLAGFFLADEAASAGATSFSPTDKR